MRGEAYKIDDKGFPGGPVIENPPSGVKDTGSIHDQETKIPCASGQLSPYITSTEHTCPGAISSQLERNLGTTTKDPTCCN